MSVILEKEDVGDVPKDLDDDKDSKLLFTNALSNLTISKDFKKKKMFNDY